MALPYTYTYVISATDELTSRELVRQSFTVVTPKPTSGIEIVLTEPILRNIAKGLQNQTILGTISSAADLDMVEVAIKDTAGNPKYAIYFHKSAGDFAADPKSLNFTDLDLQAKLQAELKFSSLDLGDYLLEIIATDVEGFEEVASYEFSVVTSPTYTLIGYAAPTLLNVGTDMSPDGTQFLVKGTLKPDNMTDAIKSVTVQIATADMTPIQGERVDLTPDIEDPASYEYDLGSRSWAIDITKLPVGEYVYLILVQSVTGAIAIAGGSVMFTVQKAPNMTVTGANKPINTIIGDKTPPMIVNGIIESDKPLQMVEVYVSYYMDLGTLGGRETAVIGATWTPEEGEVVTSFDLMDLEESPGVKFNIDYANSNLTMMAAGKDLHYTITARNEDGYAYLSTDTFVIEHYFDFSDVWMPPTQFVSGSEEAYNFVTHGVLKAPPGGQINQVDITTYSVNVDGSDPVKVLLGGSKPFGRNPATQFDTKDPVFEMMYFDELAPGVYAYMFAVQQGANSTAANYLVDTETVIMLVSDELGRIPGFNL
jgi:hypothetical protein